MTHAATELPRLNREGFTRINSAISISGISRSTCWRRINEGKFPKPIKLSEKLTVIRNSDFLDWLADPIGWKPNDAKGNSDHQNAAT